MADRYSIAFSPAGLAYVRQTLGARPFDEVWMLIQSIEQQRQEQDQPATAKPVPSPAPPLALVESTPSAEPGPELAGT
jgi:hypothetical protein